MTNKERRASDERICQLGDMVRDLLEHDRVSRVEHVTRTIRWLMVIAILLEVTGFAILISLIK
jgi:hypothetical protein